MRYWLQGLVGGPDKFEPFLKDYLQHFKFQTLTTDDFKSYFLNHFQDTPAVKDIDWQTWLYAPGGLFSWLTMTLLFFSSLQNNLPGVSRGMYTHR